MVRALLISFVNTAAAKPYVVLFARSMTSFMSLNLKMDITGPNICEIFNNINMFKKILTLCLALVSR